MKRPYRRRTFVVSVVSNYTDKDMVYHIQETLRTALGNPSVEVKSGQRVRSALKAMRTKLRRMQEPLASMIEIKLDEEGLEDMIRKIDDGRVT